MSKTRISKDCEYSLRQNLSFMNVGSRFIRMASKSIVLLIVLTICSDLYAINPDYLIGKPFSFLNLWQGATKHVYSDVSLDCFYNYTAAKPLPKQTNNNNRYYKGEKYTIQDSIFHHRFVGLSLVGDAKKGTYFIMRDDKGDTLFMSIPKYNPSKEFISYKKSYGHKSIKSKENTSFVDLDVFDLSLFEAQLDTINSTQKRSFYHETLDIPAYTMLPYSILEYGEPYVSIIRNSSDTIKNLRVDNVSSLSAQIRHLYSKFPVLDEFKNSQDQSTLSKLDSLIGKDIWVYYQPRSRYIELNSYDNSYEFGIPEWVCQRQLSSAAFGGPQYTFHKITLNNIVLSVNKAMSVEDKEYYRSRHTHLEYPDSLYFQYYLKAIPNLNDSITYNHYIHGNIRIPASSGSRTELYIPFDTNNPPVILSDEEFNKVADGFYQSEKLAWKEFNDDQKAYYDIASRVWGDEIAQIVCRGEVRLGFDEEMCHFAFMQTPFRTSNKNTPLGLAECQDFYMEGVKLYFQNKILIGIEWRGNSLFEPRHRY